MNTQETIIQLKEMKLKGMAASLETIMNLPVQARPTLELAIARMVEAEQQDRRDRKTEMYLKTSRLRYTALLEDVICGTDRNFTKEDLRYSRTVPSSEDTKTCSSKENADAESLFWLAPWEGRHAYWDTERSI